jgi:2-C-methyl-D-erythritol 4-phosphate cytidylyltransferase/2-C-methyl-D-erythritol 2,4-cyclodiphosphate synthase
VDIAAVIVAAGRGLRANHGDGDLPKQYRTLAGQPVLQRTLRAFFEHPRVSQLVAVIHADDLPLFQNATEEFGEGSINWVEGGEMRQDSVVAGLNALQSQSLGGVLIHDGARPLVSPNLIDRMIDALEHAEAALPALPVTDTLRRSQNGIAAETVDRTNLIRAQTPQAFRFEPIMAAHKAARVEGRNDFTDDAQIAQWAGLDVALVAGEPTNMKLTTAEDFEVAEHMIQAGGEWRTGTGSDVHRFGDGDHVMLCGVRVDHDRTLLGHSDADVGLHALTDALLGALGDGDIGAHFPPSDPKWAGATSDTFLADAAKRVAARGGRIANVDLTLICEEPKIGPYRDAMRERIAAILGIDVERVSVKATTTEGLGFTGRAEGIAAQASASIWLPSR